MSWGNVGFLALGVLAGVLALIGLLDAVKGTPVKRVMTASGEAPPAVGNAAFLMAMRQVARTELNPGNEVEFFWNGDQTYPRLWDDLRGARESITFQMYWCKPGRMSEILAGILIERARAGVKVFVLVDAWGTSWKRRYVQRLRDGGVRVERFRPIRFTALNVINHRSHIRVVCIDGRIGWTGGFGIDDKWFGDGRSENQWRDSNVRFTGPAVAQLQSSFVTCWAETKKGELFVGPPLFPAAEISERDRAEGALAGVLHGSPSVGSTEAERFLVLSIAGARRRLWITNSYFVPDADIRHLLRQAAQRGVDVRVLTAGEKTDVKSTRYAGRARYEHLMSAGVRVFEYEPTMMHAKTLVVDGQWCAVGSMNADNRSLSFNEETVLLLADAGAAAILEQHFTDDLRFAREIHLDEFRRRGWRERVVEAACYAFWRVL